MGRTLRLEWPQWQGAEPAAVERLTPGLSRDEGRTVYGLGGQIAAILAPPHGGPTARVDVPSYREDLPLVDGIIGKPEIIRQHEQALDLIREADADRIVTIGGTCAVSLTPFSYLAARYPDDLAVVWIDSHADTNLPGGRLNGGFNTMVVAHLIGHGDPDVLARMPATIPADRVLLAGVHGWGDIDREGVTTWGIGVAEPQPDDLFRSRVRAWLRERGVRRVAVHFDLDAIDSNEHAFGMVFEPGGISKATAMNTISDIAHEFDLVGLTIAEFVPREAVVLRTILSNLPLVSGN